MVFLWFSYGFPIAIHGERHRLPAPYRRRVLRPVGFEVHVDLNRLLGVDPGGIFGQDMLNEA